MQIKMPWVLFLLCFCTSLACAEPAESQIAVELEKPGDAVEILVEEEATVISITSWSGIGAAKLGLEYGQWPGQLVIRLNLHNLESFGISNGRIQTKTSLKSPRRVPYWKMGQAEDRPAGILECVVSQGEDTVEVVVPPEMLDGDPEFIRLRWIDAFRS